MPEITRQIAPRIGAGIAVLALAGCAGMDAGREAAGVALAREAPPSSALPATDPSPAGSVALVMDELSALGAVPLETLTVQQARRQPTIADAVRKTLTKLGRSIAPEPIGRAENRTILGSGANMYLPIRVYWPRGHHVAPGASGALPLIVYYHGGVWINGSLDSHDSSARALANAAGAIVVSVHTRQAPEHRFPAAHDDALAAYQWVLDNAATLGGDPDRVAVAGEAAGGNLAASVAIRARDRKLRMPVHQVLIYPFLDQVADAHLQRVYRDAGPLGASTLEWGVAQYLRSPADGTDPAFSPLRMPDLAGLPPATIITAGIDPLGSQGEAYAMRLQQAGGKVDFKHYPALPHDFFGMGAVVEQAKEAVSLAAAGLKSAFGN